MPAFTCSLSGRARPLPHVWEHTVGSGHAPLALRADWQAQLRRCHDELGFRHVRFHGLLSDDMGTLVTHEGGLLYSFFNADQVFDFLLSIGMRPFVELSFMPTALASGPETVFRYRANVTPPREHRQWTTLVRKLVAHWVDRYGVCEVGEWFFEVWNEPNLKAFWTGSRDEYFELYRRTAETIKRVHPALRVGGPATARNGWIEEFVAFCERSGAPADFVTTHHYPTDALGEEGDDTETQLARSERGALREQARLAHRRARGRPLFYTEWNTTTNPRDPLHDEPYAAAFVVKTVMELRGLVDGYSFWTFSDIFEENYFPSAPFHGGFGLLTLHGVPKPTYRAYELLHRLGTDLLHVEGAHATVDAWVVRRDGGLTVLLTNHALPRHAIQAETARIRLDDAPDPRAAHLERVDDEHANPRRAWREMGEPAYLRPAQVAQLEDASRLVKQPIAWRRDGPALHFSVELPPHGVAAVALELGCEHHDGDGLA